MGIDVQAEIEIGRPREEVAAWASDPDNAPRWRADIDGVEWKTSPPLATGSRVAFVTPSLGLPLAYRYTVVEHLPGQRTVYRTEEGPFPLETTLSFADAAGTGATRVTLATRGERKRGSKLAARILARTLRRSNRKDLARLKKLLEARDDG